MKKVAVSWLAFSCLASFAVAGTEYTGKEMKQSAVQQQQECWYGDTEWNVGLWGAYAFSGTDNSRTGIEDTDDLNIFGSYDRFLSADHAWGGGIDVKYFFHKYFGIGIEGFALDGRTLHAVLDHGSQASPEEFYEVNHHLVGGALGTFTLRFPIGCSRFAPYAFGGGGAVFNGSDDHAVGQDVFFPTTADHFNKGGNDTRAVGQFGGGLEVRITRHIGWNTDFSWNVVEGPHNNFGMVRSGLNFAF
jgi:hypothetical protein